MTLTINPQDAPIGAEVTGVDLAHPVDASVADEIRTALCEYAVLMFPTQELSPEAQVWLTRQLGECIQSLLVSCIRPNTDRAGAVLETRRPEWATTHLSLEGQTRRRWALPLRLVNLRGPPAVVHTAP